MTTNRFVTATARLMITVILLGIPMLAIMLVDDFDEFIDWVTAGEVK